MTIVVTVVENIIGKSKYGGVSSRWRRVNAFTIKYNSITKMVTVVTKFNYAVHFGSDICYLHGFEVGKLNAKGFDVIDGTRTGEYYPSKTHSTFTQTLSRSKLLEVSTRHSSE